LGVDLRGIVKPFKISLEQLGGRTIAVDAPNALYQFLSIIRGERGEYLMDHEGRVTSHLSGLFYRNVNLLELGIRPIYVFDGKPPVLKTMEIERRRTVKKEAEKLYNAALARGDYVEARKQAQATVYLKDQMVDDAKRILDAMGIPWIVAAKILTRFSSAQRGWLGTLRFQGSGSFQVGVFTSMWSLRRLS